jgi:hypothetical protein
VTLHEDILKEVSDMYLHNDKIIDIMVVELFNGTLIDTAPHIMIRLQKAGTIREETIYEVTPTTEVNVDKSPKPIEIVVSKTNFVSGGKLVNSGTLGCGWLHSSIWSSFGCTTEDKIDHFLCKCDHLTTFSVVPMEQEVVAEHKWDIKQEG